MTHEEAKKVLNRAREGLGDASQIRLALAVTGDLGANEGLRSETLDQEVCGDLQYLGWSAGSTVVAENLRGHRKAPGHGCPQRPEETDE